MHIRPTNKQTTTEEKKEKKISCLNTSGKCITVRSDCFFEFCLSARSPFQSSLWHPSSSSSLAVVVGLFLCTYVEVYSLSSYRRERRKPIFQNAIIIRNTKRNRTHCRPYHLLLLATPQLNET